MTTSKKKTKKKTTRRSKKKTRRKVLPKNGTWSSARIVDLRNKLGLTQEQFSQKLGVTYVSVNRWENGKALPKGLSLRALERLEKAA